MFKPYTLAYRVPSEALRCLSSWLSDAAREFEEAANIAAEYEAGKIANKKRRRTVLSAVDMMASYLVNGSTPDSAIAIVGTLTGLSPEALESCLPRADIKSKKGKRDRKIMQLVRCGYTNAEIGKAVKLSPKYVSKIIRRVRAA